MPRVLGPLETRFFAYVQGEGLRTVETGDVARVLGLTALQERKLLSRLARSGWIARVRRGLYLVPPTLPANASRGVLPSNAVCGRCVLSQEP